MSEAATKKQPNIEPTMMKTWQSADPRWGMSNFDEAPELVSVAAVVVVGVPGKKSSGRSERGSR